jgi:hypothetical protein
MTSLADQIYRQLLRQARKGSSVTYAELAARVRPAVHPRSPAFHAALGEVSLACRHEQLPCLPAIVWRAHANRPSDGYYKVAHPRAHTEQARIAAWEREHDRVLREVEQFPARLSGAQK